MKEKIVEGPFSFLKKLVGIKTNHIWDSNGAEIIRHNGTKFKRYWCEADNCMAYKIVEKTND